MSAPQPPHIVLLVSPGAGAGHLRPVAELARRLAADHGFTATIVTYTNHSSPTQYSSVLSSLPPSITTTALPEVPTDDLPNHARIETRLITVVRRTLPHLRELLRSLSDAPAGVAAFFADVFCPSALQVAAELGIPRYVVFTANLMALASFLYLPEQDRTTTCEYRDLPEPVLLPGCVPLRGADLIEPIQDRGNPAYPLMVDLGRQYLLADGFIVNTFDGMEHALLIAFQELSDNGVYPPVYPVGPITRQCSDEDAQHGCLRWLDGHAAGSVLYVCFGSGGALSVEQTLELAAGLEASGQRFLWVVCFPSDKDCSAGYLGSPADSHGEDPLSYLPEGFVERTSGRGLAVPQWAPQVEILNHPAVGGFLSHCGWNSTLESAAAGVPMVAWPLFAEQRMNAVMLEERAGMALRPKAREGDGVVPREEVAAAVKELMIGEKGETARLKAREMRDAVAVALAPDGPARRALEAVASKWKRRDGTGE
ncbi:hydroquinone glucosyltransferase-like [Lolium rigidum]|uniref:hydroquinone glucosyltransferase-like n=1 Tax=Lolium rigidum TaxID=89674 RepID=UPI001F5D1FD1|nr:hydroquinone glucosyltransferase-like [Lolium rigidum]